MLSRLNRTWLRFRRRLSRAELAARRLNLPVSDVPDHTPGILWIQIDGLARRQLEHAIARGRMPFLKKLQSRHRYRLHDFYPGLPATTPAVQAELHYGVRAAVPAFSFLDERTGSIDMMMQPEAAKRIEADLAAQAEGVLRGGSSWSNIYTGGADQNDAHFCAASIGLGDMWRTGKIGTIFSFAFLHFPSFLRLIALLPLELIIALADAVRGVTQRQKWTRELSFVVARVFVCVGLREMITLGTKIDLARGLPIIHVNFLGYDEQSHRRGPGSAFAHWTLRGIDRSIKQLHRAARRSGRRDYEVLIFSDHGQVPSRPFSREVEGGLEALVRRHWPDPERLSSPAPNSAVRSQQSTSPGAWLGGPRRAAREARHQAAANLRADERDAFAVAAMGPVGHIYFGYPLSAEKTRQLAARLVAHGVPGALLRRPDGKVDWLTPTGDLILPDHAAELPHKAERRATIATDLVALAHQARAGDLVVLGWGRDGTSFSFAEENGAHAGPSPDETGPFLLTPAHVQLKPAEAIFRPSDLRAMALQHLGRSAPEVKSRPSVSVRASNPPPPAAPTREERTIRVATYNIHSCCGLDGRYAPNRIAHVIAQTQADIIALQEIDVGQTRSRREDQLQHLADALGYHAYYAEAWKGGDGAYGHGILSRFPLREVRHAPLPRGGRRAEIRVAIHAVVDIEGHDLHFIAAHLGLGRRERIQQIDALVGDTWIGTVPPDDPVILAGDFNTPAGGPGYRRLTRDLHDVQAHAPGHVALRTFPSFLPMRRIDHVFVTPRLGVEAVHTINDERARLASDHLPLIATLRLHLPRNKSSKPAGRTHSPARLESPITR